MKTVEVMVFAGGRGERLRPRTDREQKCVLPISGEPAIYWVISALLQAFGSVDLKIGVEYKQEQVKACVAKKFGGDRRVSAAYIPYVPGVGTLGAYKAVTRFVKAPVLGVPGDVIATGATYKNLAETHQRARNELTLTATAALETARSHGVILGRDGVVDQLKWPNPCPNAGLRDMTMYAMNRAVIDALKLFPAKSEGAFTNFVQHLVLLHTSNIGFFESSDSFVHIAYIEDLQKEVPRELYSAVH